MSCHNCRCGEVEFCALCLNHTYGTDDDYKTKTRMVCYIHEMSREPTSPNDLYIGYRYICDEHRESITTDDCILLYEKFRDNGKKRVDVVSDLEDFYCVVKKKEIMNDVIDFNDRGRYIQIDIKPEDGYSDEDFRMDKENLYTLLERIKREATIPSGRRD